MCDKNQLQPGCSAVYGGDFQRFYTVHFLAISNIIISLIGCVIVIISIFHRYNPNEEGGFSDRFPLYLAVADLLWGISHLNEHLILLSIQVYPGMNLVIPIAAISFFLIGYQQLMYGAVAVYTYLKIVWRMSLNLGRWEWKLQGACVLIMASCTAGMIKHDALGISKYWFFVGSYKPEGRAVLVILSLTTLFQSICTIIAYILIRRSVHAHRKAVLGISGGASCSSDHHATAIKCLTTFVKVGLALYLPFTIIVVTSNSLIFLFKVSPSSFPFFLVILSNIFVNAGGWVNAVAYFHNRRIKRLAARRGGTVRSNTVSSNRTSSLEA